MYKSFKWKKQELLFDYGLRERSEFFANIKIFFKSQTNDALRCIYDQLSLAKGITNIVLIQVPVEHRYLLKNCVLNSMVDIDKAEEFIKRTGEKEELWMCLNSKNSTDALSGRYNINYKNGEEEHVLEIIEDIYPRKLERISRLTYNKYYGLFTRKHWAMGYSTEYEENKKRQIYKSEIFVNIERNRESLERLCEYINEKSVYSISFEFKCINGEFTFIDWDSENDSKIVF